MDTPAPPLWRGLDRALSLLENIAAFLAAAIVLLAMVLVSLDAVMRYALNAPITFQYTLTESYLMIALVCLPMAWGFRTGGYIRIEGLLMALPEAVRAPILRAGLLLSAVYVLALAWTGGKHFWTAFVTGEVQFGVIDWPVWASWIWIPIGCGLLALRLVLCAFGPTEGLQADSHGGHLE